MKIAEKLRLLIEYMPVLSMAQDIVVAAPGAPRVRSALELLEVLAEKTETHTDNELIDLCRKVVMTAEGAALVDYISEKARALFDDQEDENVTD